MNNNNNKISGKIERIEFIRDETTFYIELQNLKRIRILLK